MRVLTGPSYGLSVLLCALLGLWSSPALATCDACRDLAAERDRLAAEMERVEKGLEDVEAFIERIEGLLEDARAALAVFDVPFDEPPPNVQLLLQQIEFWADRLADNQGQKATLEEWLDSLGRRLDEVSRQLRSCEKEECSTEEKPEGCIDPLDLPSVPLVFPAVPGTDCSVCEEAYEAYRRLASDAAEFRDEVYALRREATQAHQEAESLCRTIRRLEFGIDPVPQQMREELRHTMQRVDDLVAQAAQALRELEGLLRAIDAAYGEVRDCEERYCGRVFQEFGSGGRVSSPDPVPIVDFSVRPLFDPHPLVSTWCDACEDTVAWVNERIAEYNEFVRALNGRIEQLRAIEAELADLRKLSTTELTNREIVRLQERGVSLEAEIEDQTVELRWWWELVPFFDLPVGECEKENCRLGLVVAPSARLLEVQGEGADHFTPGGVGGVGTDGVGGISVDLAVSKSGPAEAAAGDEITYVVEVVNQGLDAADFGLRDPIPIGAGFVSVTPEAGCSLSGRNLDCSGRLEPGERREYRIVVEVLEGADTLRNVAAVNTVVGVTDPEPSNNISDVVVTRIVAEPAETDLSVSMSGPGTAAPGDPVRYDVRVENAGPDEATGVMVEITVPADIDVTGVGAGCTRSGRTVTCDLGNLAVGAAGSTFVEGTVADGASGTLTVEATVSANTLDPNPGNDRARRRTRVEEDEPEPTGCAALSGKFTAGGGDCGFSGSLNVSGTDGGQTLVLNPLGENGATRFSISGDTAQSESDNLVIKGQPNHRCKMTCRPPSRFTLDCESTRPGGRTCSQDFKKPQ